MTSENIFTVGDPEKLQRLQNAFSLCSLEDDNTPVVLTCLAHTEEGPCDTDLSQNAKAIKSCLIEIMGEILREGTAEGSTTIPFLLHNIAQWRLCHKDHGMSAPKQVGHILSRFEGQFNNWTESEMDIVHRKALFSKQTTGPKPSSTNIGEDIDNRSRDKGEPGDYFAENGGLTPIVDDATPASTKSYGSSTAGDGQETPVETPSSEPSSKRHWTRYQARLTQESPSSHKEAPSPSVMAKNKRRSRVNRDTSVRPDSPTWGDSKAGDSKKERVEAQKQKSSFQDPMISSNGSPAEHNDAPGPVDTRISETESTVKTTPAKAGNNIPKYGHCTPKKDPLNKFLVAMMNKVSDEHLKPGFVYGFEDSTIPGLLKIGCTSVEPKSGNPVTKVKLAMLNLRKPSLFKSGFEDKIHCLWGRMDEHSACRPTLEVKFAIYMPCAARRMEILVHHVLHTSSRTVPTCHCGRDHKETFEISVEDAQKTVSEWAEFSAMMPYDATTKILKPRWKVFVEENLLADVKLGEWLRDSWCAFQVEQAGDEEIRKTRKAAEESNTWLSLRMHTIEKLRQTQLTILKWEKEKKSLEKTLKGFDTQRSQRKKVWAASKALLRASTQ